MIGIYLIKSKIDSRKYIGSTIDFKKRKICHLKTLKKNKHHSIKLQRFYNKYGKDFLIFKFIEYCDFNKKDLIEREQFYINFYNSYKKGFNSKPFADNSLGVKLTKKAKMKISVANKGNKYCLGRILSDVTKNKMRKKAIGRKQSIRTINKRVKKNKGKKRSIEAIQKTIKKTQKLTYKQVQEIKNLLKIGIYQKDIAKMFNVCQRTICRINLNISYLENL